MDLKIIKLAVFAILIFLLTSCGGGSASNESSPPNSASNQNTDPWVASKPQYSGLRSKFYINEQEAPEFSYDLLDSLDLISSVGLSSISFLLLNNSSQLDDEVECSSGSLDTQVVESNSRVEVKYSTCKFDGIEVDGDIRASINNNGIVTVILDLTVTEIISGEKLAISGFYVTDESTESIYNLLFKNVINNQEIWFDEFSVKNDNRSLTYKGNMYLSDRGQVSISTIDSSPPHTRENYFVELQVSSENNFSIYALYNSEFTLHYSNDYLPITIPLDNTEYLTFQNTNNSTPVAKINVSNDVADRNEFIDVFAIDSYDPDFELLTYEWTLLNQPDGSDPTLPTGASGAFSGDLPGVYTIRLTVRDFSGNKSHTDIALKILKDIPIGEILLSVNNNTIGTPINAEIYLENDNFDGPFYYELKYGPANMSVNSQGMITWDGKIPNYGISTDVNFAVLVSNQNKHNVLKSSIAMESQEEVTVEPVTQYIPNISSSFKSSSGTYYSSDNNALNQLTTNENMEPIWVNKYPVESYVGLIKYQATSDVNNDGIDDFWFSYLAQTGTNSGAYIGWKDGKTKEINKVIEFANSLTVNSVYIGLVDYDKDGIHELLYDVDASYITKLYNVKENIEIASFNNLDVNARSPTFDVCDANNDSFSDIFINNRIYDLKNAETLLDLSYDSAYYLEAESGHCLFVKEVDQSLILIDVTDNNERVIFNSDYYDWSFNIGNFDADPFDEVLIQEYKVNEESQTTLLNQIETTSPVLINIENSPPITFKNAIIADIDGDGIDEFTIIDEFNPVKESDNYYLVNQLTSYFIDKEKQLNAITSNSIIASPKTISHWTDEKVILKNHTVHSKVVIDASNFAEIKYYNQFTSSRIETSFVNGTTYIYKNGATETSLIKQDINQTVYWQIELEGTVGNMRLVSDGVLYFTVGDNAETAILLNTESGGILYSKKWLDNTRPNFITSYSAINGTHYILDAKRLGVVSVSKDLQVSHLLEVSDLKSMLDVNSKIDFAQFDSDSTLEMIIYNRLEGEDRYQIFDLESLTFTSLNLTKNGLLEHQENLFFSEELMNCFPWDKTCVNSIRSSTTDNGHTNSYKVIDKYSGNIIWQSPAFTFGEIKDIKFKEEYSGIQTMISSGSAVNKVATIH